MSLIHKIILVLICITGFLMCFWGLGERYLERWDEETNVAVVNSINNNFELKINNKPFLEKPPLWYYLTFLTAKILGDNNFSYRFVSAFSGFLLMLAIIFYCIRNFNPNTAIFSSIVFLTTSQLFYINPDGAFSTHNIRSADLDLLQMLFNFVSLFLIVEYEKSKSQKLIIIGGIFCGLGIMSKGFISLLIPLTWILWQFTKIYKTKLSILPILRFFLVVFLVASPWHIYMVLNHGNEFTQTYFFYHYFQRATQTIEQHYGYTFHHIENLLNPNFFSSGIILFFGLVYILFTKKILNAEFGIITLFTLLYLILITFVETKIAWYLLGIYPTAAIICGLFYDNLFKKILHHRKILIDK